MHDFRKVIEVAKQVNLCTYFILPFTTTNILRFGGKSNCLNSYLSRDGKFIFIEVKNLYKVDNDLVDEPTYHIDERTFIMLQIPEEFYSDVRLFLEGKYSKFSEKAKRIIREGSSLEYQVYKGSVAVSDYRLLALAGSETLRAELAKIIYDEKDMHHRNEIGEELLSRPEDDTFFPFPIPTKNPL